MTLSTTPQVTGTGAPRSLHEVCEDARRGHCGYCSAMASELCGFSGTGPNGYHVARFAWAEANGLISAADFDTALEAVAAAPFSNATVIYDHERRSAMGTQDSTAAKPLGPFETSGDAQRAVRPDDGSFTGREALLDFLKDTLRAAWVDLGGWDWTVLRWLADLDVQTVAAVAGWVGRANRQLLNETAVTVTTTQAALIAKALADAETYRRPHAEDWCADCETAPQGACEDHLNDLDQADAYRDLAAELARALQEGLR
jgi:hypothetical protein